MLKKLAPIICCLLVLAGCIPESKNPKVRIAINAWPGYEFLYLAKQKGMFAEHGLNVEIVELSTLSDVQRVYTQGRVDGFGSSIVESVQAAGVTQEPLDIVLISDFSSGGDEILAIKPIKSISDLKGKQVGVEVGTLGIYVLHTALKKYGMTLDDVNVVNVEQLNVDTSMDNREIDAVVTYSIDSIAWSQLTKYQRIFDTRETPNKVIDVISIRRDVIADQKQWVEQFHQVWRQVLAFTKANPGEAYEIMAKREGVSVDEFTKALSGLKTIEQAEQVPLLKSNLLQVNISEVCDVLKQTSAIEFECNNINELVKGYDGY
jgi:NitT/TauT family transport system substrate-binding protein